jgi:metal-responsive CopG/Arc/MetJ family transcriptional regulator
MKAAVSIPDDLFADAERLVSRFKTSRSQLYARALSEFIARHDDDHLTELLNQSYDEANEVADLFIKTVASKTLRNTEW